MDTSILEYLSFCFLVLGLVMLISAIWYFFKHKIRTVYSELKYGQYTLDEHAGVYSADFSSGREADQNAFRSASSYAELVPDSAESSRLEKLKSVSKNYEKGGTEAFGSVQDRSSEVVFTSRGASPMQKSDARKTAASSREKPKSPIFTVEEDGEMDELTMPLPQMGGGYEPPKPTSSRKQASKQDVDELTVPLNESLLGEDELTVPLNNEGEDYTAPLTEDLNPEIEARIRRLSSNNAFTIEDPLPKERNLKPESKPKRNYKRRNNSSYLNLAASDSEEDEETMFLDEEDEEYFEEVQNRLYEEEEESDRYYEEELERIEEEHQEYLEELEREQREWEEEQDYLFWRGY